MNYTFSYYLSERELKNYLFRKGFVIKTCRQLLKEMKLKASEYFIADKCQALRISFAYLPGEEHIFLMKFRNNILDRKRYSKYSNGKYFSGKYSYFNPQDSISSVGEYILDIRARNLMREEFTNKVLGI